MVWPVLTVLVVHSGNRGRRDVLARGARRVVGAPAGTGIAAVVGGLSGTGDDVALVVLFALLYGYAGEPGIRLPGHRLLGIPSGGTLALTRLRLAQLLTAAAGATGSAARAQPLADPARALIASVRQLAAPDGPPVPRAGSGSVASAVCTPCSSLRTTSRMVCSPPPRAPERARMAELARDLGLTHVSIAPERRPRDIVGR